MNFITNKLARRIGIVLCIVLIVDLFFSTFIYGLNFVIQRKYDENYFTFLYDANLLVFKVFFVVSLFVGVVIGLITAVQKLVQRW